MTLFPDQREQRLTEYAEKIVRAESVGQGVLTI